MEIEIRGIPQSLRSSYQVCIKASTADLTRYKLRNDAHAQLSRSELPALPGIGGASTSDEPYGASDRRTRLLTGAALLKDDSQRIPLETKEPGTVILRALHGHREKFLSRRGHGACAFTASYEVRYVLSSLPDPSSINAIFPSPVSRSPSLLDPDLRRKSCAWGVGEATVATRNERCGEEHRHTMSLARKKVAGWFGKRQQRRTLQPEVPPSRGKHVREASRVRGILQGRMNPRSLTLVRRKFILVKIRVSSHTS